MMDQRMMNVLAALAQTGAPVAQMPGGLGEALMPQPMQGQGMTLGDILAQGAAMPPVLRRQMRQALPPQMMPQGTI